MADLPSGSDEGALEVVLNDATTPANKSTIKAASTAAVATDTSLVIALSPNSPVPTGTNNIGSITNITGTISLPTGAATSALQTSGNTSLSTIASAVISQGTALGTNPQIMVGGSVTTASPTYTTGQISPLSLDTAGNLRVNVVTGATSGTVPQGSTTSGQSGNLVQGAVTTAAPSYTTGTTNPLSLTIAGALRHDISSIAGTAIVTAASGLLKVGISGATGVTLDVAQNAAAPANELVVGAVYNSAAPTLTSGNATQLQADVNGNLKVNLITALPTGANTIGAVNQGTSPWVTQDKSDTAITSSVGTASGFALGVSGLYNTTQPAPTNGQQVELQTDQSANLLQFPGISIKTGAAWSSATAVNTFQYPTGTATQGAFSGAQAYIVQLDQTTLTAGAVTFQGTSDNINWVTIPNSQVLNPQTFTPIVNPYTFVASTNKQFLIVASGFIAIRANLTTAITGTGTVTPYWSTLAHNPVTTVIATSIDGRRTTYRASSGTVATNVVTPAFTPVLGVMFQLQGSATKTIRVLRFNFTVSGATNTFLDLTAVRTSTAATGGTAVTPTIAKLDSNDIAATAVATYYTVAPTPGTFVGNYSSTRILVPSTTIPTSGVFEMDFGNFPGGKGFVLNSASDYFTIQLAGTLPTTPTMDFWCEWTEE